jgi:uncharacterized membrane protein YraQ (UPF0718 family)
VKGLARWSKQNWLVWAVLLAYAVLAIRHPALAVRAAELSARTFLGLLPTLVGVFVLVGLFQVWMTDEFIVRHLGEGSGFKGVALGAGLGTAIHGPLVAIFPLLQALLVKRARLGVVVAIVSTWAIKLPMIPLELQLFGWRFTLLREGLLFCSAFVMAPLMELALGVDWSIRYRASLKKG